MAYETGKQRAARVPLDYFKHPDWLQRWKLRFTGLALVFTLAWLAIGWVRSDQGRYRYSRGPVAAVHGAWETECQACHVSFMPMDSKEGMGHLLGLRSESDTRCVVCHKGPEHHASQITEQTPGCGHCHRDHRGVDAKLARVADGDCTLCHGNLTKHVKAGVQTEYQNVSLFEARPAGSTSLGHPNFKVFREPNSADPGMLRLNHKRHMTPGMVLTADGKAFTLADIKDSAERERYRLQQPEGQRADSSPVHLDCVSCHRLDSGNFGIKPDMLGNLPTQPLLPPRAPGAYMLPIVYDMQCKACHPLDLERAKPDNPKVASLTLPHRLQPQDMHGWLTKTFENRYLKGEGSNLLDKFVPVRPIPGKAMTEPSKLTALAKDAIANQVYESEKAMYWNAKLCGECHHFDTTKPGGKVDPALVKLGTAPDLRVRPTAVPVIWYQHASFNHAAHRSVDCRQCHAKAYPFLPDGKANPTVSEKTGDIMVPDIENCLQCHAPRSHAGGQPRGGARFDCAECHRYHNGDNPMQGIGATAQDAKKKRTIQQVLQGND